MLSKSATIPPPIALHGSPCRGSQSARGSSRGSVMEIWKPVVGFEGIYEVSSDGRVKSVRDENNSYVGRIRTPAVYRTGYKFYRLYKNGIPSYHREHRLVGKAFIPNPLNKPHINHKNGMPGDNQVGNLEWVTEKENKLHATQILCRGIGSKNGQAKLREADIPLILKLSAAGRSSKWIANKYGVRRQSIYGILVGKTWCHASGIPRHLKRS